MSTFKYPTSNQMKGNFFFKTTLNFLTCLMRTSNAAMKSSCWMWWLITCSKSEKKIPLTIINFLNN